MSRVLRSIVGLLISAFAVLSSSQLPLSGGTFDRPFVPSNRWALVVGVSGYSRQIGALHYTAKEAREFAGALTQDLAFDPENVRLLADGGQSPVVPTSANILAALDSLLSDKRLDKANLFVFYFSGHGVGTPSGDYLLPADIARGEYETKGVPVREVIRRIVGAGLKNVLFIADACRAGTQNDFGEDLTELCHKANLAVILGCSPGARSYEYPEFERGAFTNFLLEDLKRPELRDASGALWASKLGEDVSKRTYDFTFPDKDINAQKPAIWAETSTLDVLLAAYPQAGITDEAVKGFKATAARLDRKDYAAAMISYASALFEKDRFDATVDMLKTVDALGEMTPAARLAYSSALLLLGRRGEAERNFAVLQALPPGFWRDMGTALGSSRAMPPDVRLKSAFALFEGAESWAVASLAFDEIAQWGTDEQRRRYATLFAKLDAEAPRHRNYAAGRLAAAEGRWSDAVAAYERAFASPGDLPYDQALAEHEFRAVAALHDEKAMATFFGKGRAAGVLAGLDDLVAAMQAGSRGDLAARTARLRRGLAKPIQPDLLFIAAQAAKTSIGDLSKEFTAAAERFPFSWRAQFVLYVLATLRDDKVAMAAHLSSVDKYLDDPMTLESSVYDFMDDYLTEGVEQGRVPDSVRRSQIEIYFFRLRGYLDRFGFDPEMWGRFVRYGLDGGRGGQTSRMVAAHLGLTPEATPRELRTVLTDLAMSRGDAATARRLFAGGYAHDGETVPIWDHALFEATNGNKALASTLIKGLALPEGLTGRRMDALRTYLLAAGGHAAEARRRLRVRQNDPLVEEIDGMAWAALGDWPRAEPLLAAHTKLVNYRYLYVHAWALGALDARYRATGRTALAKKLAIVWSMEEPGNALFDRFVVAEKSGRAQFAGSVSMPCSVRDDMAAAEGKGTLTFGVDSQGGFTARLSGKGVETATLSGKVDDYGNVRGTGLYKGKRYAFGSKIASMKEYRLYEKSAAVAQIFQMIDADGLRVDLLGWPQGWPPGLSAQP